MDPMNILFVWPSAEWSTFDVGIGYNDALQRTEHNVREWRFYNRIKLVTKAFEVEPTPETLPELFRHASNMIVVDAVQHLAQWVVITSAMGFHPEALVLLQRIGVKIATIITESPYDDDLVGDIVKLSDLVFTNDLTSAERHPEWRYLAAAIDPYRHHPQLPDGTMRNHDVVVVGTGWQERVRTMAQMDWAGINLGIYGFWPQLREDDESVNGGMPKAEGMEFDAHAAQVLSKFYTQEPTENHETAQLYAGAKICINQHRYHHLARSANPRCYEVLACAGGLLLTDYREDLPEILGERWREFVYRDARELEQKIRYYLAHEQERVELVQYGLERVTNETFDARVQTLLEAMVSYDNQP
jgi:spore maturation protein CgeB